MMNSWVSGICHSLGAYPTRTGILRITHDFVPLIQSAKGFAIGRIVVEAVLFYYPVISLPLRGVDLYADIKVFSIQH